MKVDINLKALGAEIAASSARETATLINHFSYAVRERSTLTSVGPVGDKQLDEISKCLDANSRIVLEKLVSYFKDKP